MKFIKDYASPRDLPAVIPVFPLNGALLLPRADLPLNIFEPRYLAMIEDALKAERIIGMIQTAEEEEKSTPPALMKIGCAGRLTSFAETPDQRVLITLTGVCRFTVMKEMPATTPYRQVEADFDAFEIDLVSDLGANEVNRPALLTAFKDYLAANNMNADWNEIAARPLCRTREAGLARGA
jgi:Lon protease-like protein